VDNHTLWTGIMAELLVSVTLRTSGLIQDFVDMDMDLTLQESNGTFV